MILALKGSVSVSILLSSSMAVSDLVGCTSDMFGSWFCEDNVIELILGGLWVLYKKSLDWLWDVGVDMGIILVGVEVLLRGGGVGNFLWAVVFEGWLWDLSLFLDKLRVSGGDVLLFFE